MNIAILNGKPDAQNNSFDLYLGSLRESLEQRGNSVTMLNLKEMDIKRCTGCWSCWLKTPGRCAVKDDSEAVCRAYIHADLVVFASPVIMGLTSALLKKAQDKLIPLILPYIELDQDECHHVPRYGRYPAIALVLDRNGADDEDIAIITDIYRRMAINIKTGLAFVKTTETAPEEAAYEVNRI